MKGLLRVIEIWDLKWDLREEQVWVWREVKKEEERFSFGFLRF